MTDQGAFDAYCLAIECKCYTAASKLCGILMRRGILIVIEDDGSRTMEALPGLAEHIAEAMKVYK